MTIHETFLSRRCDVECITKEMHIESGAAPDLTIVIPALNEEERLPAMLATTVNFLETWTKSMKLSYEVSTPIRPEDVPTPLIDPQVHLIACPSSPLRPMPVPVLAPSRSQLLVVDDGSSDRTASAPYLLAAARALRSGATGAGSSSCIAGADSAPAASTGTVTKEDENEKVAQDMVADSGSTRCGPDLAEPEIRVLKLPLNRGKGGAVARGVAYSRGRYILLADADGATDVCSDFTRSLFHAVQ